MVKSRYDSGEDIVRVMDTWLFNDDVSRARMHLGMGFKEIYPTIENGRLVIRAVRYCLPQEISTVVVI
jgi:hypothetical protein